MSVLMVIAGFALIPLAIWAMIRGGGPPAGDHGADMRNAKDLTLIP